VTASVHERKEVPRASISLLILISVSIGYVGALATIDSEAKVFANFNEIVWILPVVLAGASAAYVMRYLRW
jgi:hypothetical protein